MGKRILYFLISPALLWIRVVCVLWPEEIGYVFAVVRREK